MKICEHFYSLQGEGKYIGTPSYFIRLSGCPLRCDFCDSKFAWNHGKNDIIIDDDKSIRKFFMNNIHGKGFDHIVITGGEPLYKDNIETLFRFIKFINNYSAYDKTYKFSIETSGIYDPYKIKNNNILNVINELSWKYNSDGEEDSMLSDITLSVSPKFSVDAYKGYDISKDDLYKYYSLKGMSLTSYSLDNVYYKFVHTNDTISDIVHFLSTYILYKFKDRVFVMPVTDIPFNEKDYNDKCKLVANFCKENCIRYSPRLHVDLWGLMKGV